MIQVYVDGVLAYDSRLDDYELEGLQVTTALNKGGTAEIVMPTYHPACGMFTSYRSIVEIYRDQELQFRGRALYPVDNYRNQRTVYCEGEMCFFQDAVSRPYLYQASPAEVFTAVLNEYNGQVEAFKQFRLGEITVTDANDYIRLESQSAETVLDTVNKLLERCGGYIVFTSASDGARVVNWYESLGYRSNQAIEFNTNLLNFARSGANTNLVTAVVPYGAQDVDGNRVTIEGVNNGQDYIVDEDARAIRGFICKPIFYDDVTDPNNLLTKARQYLTNNRYIITSLELTALDLSYLDKSIDSFQVGDTIRVRSKPHSVDEDFQLMERTDDLLNVANSRVTLGKDRSTLTDADVAGDNQNRNELHKVTHQITANYKLGIANAVAETERTLSSLIDQTSEAIKTEVSKTYTTNEQLQESISTSLTQLSDSFTYEFNELWQAVDENGAIIEDRFTELYSYIRMEGGVLSFGSNENSITLEIDHDLIVFKKDGVQFGWWDGVDFYTGNIIVQVDERAQFGNFAYVPRSNGSLSFLKVADYKAIEITQQPQSVNTTIGTAVTVSVKATGSELTYQWQYSTDGTAWEDMSGSTSTSISVTFPAASTRHYRCIITDSIGKTAVTNVATVKATKA